MEESPKKTDPKKASDPVKAARDDQRGSPETSNL